jgi:hypothetical protein
MAGIGVIRLSGTYMEEGSYPMHVDGSLCSAHSKMPYSARARASVQTLLS